MRVHEVRWDNSVLICCLIYCGENTYGLIQSEFKFSLNVCVDKLYLSTHNGYKYHSRQNVPMG